MQVSFSSQSKILIGRHTKKQKQKNKYKKMLADLTEIYLEIEKYKHIWYEVIQEKFLFTILFKKEWHKKNKIKKIKINKKKTRKKTWNFGL